MSEEKKELKKSKIEQKKNLLEISFNERFYPEEVVRKAIESYDEAEIKDKKVILKTKDKEEAYDFYDQLLEIMQGGPAWH